MNIHVVVMGVAGCGKSTVAEAIRDRLGFELAEGDDFHPQANIDKMSAGIPLTDEDRWPWLRVINTWMIARDSLDQSTVVSSSALKRAYRDVLRENVPVFFVHLVGTQEMISERLAARKGHFMPPALLPSQFAILEPLQEDEPGIEISIEGSVDDMVERALEAVKEHAAKEEAALTAAVA
ncbi:gluconate kinase [Bifidobacterium lemurum]|uniref:Gluconokinase n=1 Tax=Bifidobacterium lemurum TaxID=1603886 RepID=A0A261FTV4_9BIFI|nr:gluconokinase [Bifidobacterium lemurum]OZG62186.1 gluconate kinase [Bifidobacterium lemurum]QOL33561.1 gluconokinase [Bifidobacterium lemurum]